jgi:nucleoside-diphosphate-sugar epimerase
MEKTLTGRVLLTGANGFVGSHLMDRLRSRKADVRCFVHPATSTVEAAAEAESVEGDITDGEQVHAAMEDVSTVIHLAGIATVGAAQSSPDDAFRVNTLGTQNVLEAARRRGAIRVVVMSTAHVYGSAVRLPVNEDHPVAPASIYAATKLAADVMALAYARNFGVPVTVLRPFNIYGPRQSTAAVIPSIVAQAVSGQPVQVRDLRPRRDFVYIHDVIEALLLAATTDAATGQAIVLASGVAVSVASIVRRVVTLASGRVAAAPEEPEPGSDCVFGDASRAKELLGWHPRVDLDAGLRHTIAWHREHSRPS